MPWRTAAGVLGMERTTLAATPRWAAKYCSVWRAAIDRNTEPSSERRLRSGNTASIDCGFTASTTTSGRSLTSEVEATVRSPGFLGRSASTGSATITSSAARPRASQPSSMAPPILPQPTSSRLPIRRPSPAFEFRRPLLAEGGSAFLAVLAAGDALELVAFGHEDLGRTARQRLVGEVAQGADHQRRRLGDDAGH